MFKNKNLEMKAQIKKELKEELRDELLDELRNSAEYKVSEKIKQELQQEFLRMNIHYSEEIEIRKELAELRSYYEKINSEKFLDEVIERINRKQVK